MHRSSQVTFGALLVGIIGLALVAGSVAPVMANARLGQGVPLVAPNETCEYTTFSFSLSGIGTAGVSRPVAATEGDTFAQFIAPPITATAASQVFVTANDSFSGSLSNGATGSFTLNNLNGILVTSPEGSPNNPRGLAVNEIVIATSNGTITAVLAINSLSTSASAPYYPRIFNGYLHSTSTSGAYAGSKYYGAIGGSIASAGGGLAITAGVTGRLYTGGGTLNEAIAAIRETPQGRTLTFGASDVIAQFTRPDLTAGGSVGGHVDRGTTFAGGATGTLDFGFVLQHNSLLLDAGSNTGRGWLVGEFTLSNTSGEVLTGPWLTDRTNNGLSGYVFQVLGTGTYSQSVLFANISGTLFGQGGANFAGSMNGTFCEGPQPPTPSPTAQVTSTPTALTATTTQTSLPVATTTATPMTSTPTSTLVTQATGTTIPSATITPISSTSTAQATSTGTSVPGSTSTPTTTPAVQATSTSTAVTSPTVTAQTTSTLAPTATGTVPATPTATVCNITFSDVPADNTFYANIRCLACRGILGGYSDGTFRPNNPITRGQLSKIVANSAGFSEPVSGQRFTDVAPGSTFYEFVERMAGRGILGGYSDGTFRPNSNATRGQISKIVANAAGFVEPVSGQRFTDVVPGSTFYEFIERLASRGVMGGYSDGTFRPNNDATRGQTSKIVANTFYPNCATTER